MSIFKKYVSGLHLSCYGAMVIQLYLSSLDLGFSLPTSQQYWSLRRVYAHNVEVLFADDMPLNAHIAKRTKDCYFQLYQLGSIHDNPTVPTAQTLLHAYITSRLDGWNSPFIAMLKYLTKWLQGEWNTTALMVDRPEKVDHIYIYDFQYKRV